MLLLTHRLSFWLTVNLILSCMWAPVLRANDTIVSCEGFGADRGLALKQAMDQCRSIASDQVKGASFKVTQISVESNEENAWHSEISSEMRVSGLVCKPIKESTAANEDGEYHTSLTCRFDLSQAKIGPAKPELKTSNITRSNSRQIIINSVPACSSIVVRGERPRSIKCTDNPQSIAIYYDLDKEIIIRAKGYLPKTISIPSQTDSNETEILNALLVRY